MTTANFNKLDKSMLDAMRDSNYFKREGVEGVYKGNPSIGIESGSPEINKKFEANPKSFFGDSNGFLDNFKKGAKSYLEESKEKSDTDKYLDFMRETRDMASDTAKFGNMGSGFSTEVAEGLNVYKPPSTQQMFIPGQQGQPGFFGRMAGQVLGSAAGAVGAGLGKAAIGMLCDIRAKEDIAPLNKINIEINDDLSECAYFVKDLQSGMFG